MELSQLHYFRIAAQMEHFTKAARALHITQPTLSATIANLEDELGVKLFDREKGKIRLNEYGRALLQEVNLVFLHLNEGIHMVNSLKSAEGGNIYFAAAVLEQVTPLVGPYLLNHPNIHLYQSQHTAKEMHQLLELREIDIAVSFFSLQSPSVEWFPVFKDEQGILVSVDHPLAAQKQVALRDLAHERFLVNNSNQDLHDQFVGYCFQAGFEPNIMFEGNQPDLIGDLVANNYGVSLISKGRYKFHEACGETSRTTYLKITDVDCTWTTGIAKLKGRPLSSAARHFFEYLMQSFRNISSDHTPI